MSIQGLNHVSVTVADIETALAFWRDALGLELTGRGVAEHDHLDRITGLANARIEWAELAIPGGGVLELFRYLHPPGTAVHLAPNDPGATHIAFQVTDIDELDARVRRAGFTARSDGPIEIPSGDWRGWRDLYITSPDGVIVELSEAPAQR